METIKKIHFSFGDHISVPGKLDSIQAKLEKFFLVTPSVRNIYFLEDAEATTSHIEALRIAQHNSACFSDAFIKATMLSYYKHVPSPREIKKIQQGLFKQSKEEISSDGFRAQEISMLDRMGKSYKFKVESEGYSRNEFPELHQKRNAFFKCGNEAAAATIKGDLNNALKSLKKDILSAADYMSYRDVRVAKRVSSIALGSKEAIRMFVRFGEFHEDLVRLTSEATSECEDLSIESSFDQGKISRSFKDELMIILQRNPQFELTEPMLEKGLLDGFLAAHTKQIKMTRAEQTDLSNKILGGMTPEDIHEALKNIKIKGPQNVISSILSQKQ